MSPRFCKTLLLSFSAASLTGCASLHGRQYPEINVRCFSRESGLDLETRTYNDAKIIYSPTQDYFYIYRNGEPVAQYPSSCEIGTPSLKK